MKTEATFGSQHDEPHRTNHGLTAALGGGLPLCVEDDDGVHPEAAPTAPDVAASIDEAGPVEMPERPAVTEKQIIARRVNGAKSHGPRTEAGKARSRLNALKHGGYSKSSGVITQGPLAEDPDEYERHLQAVLTSLPHADSPLLAALGEKVAQALWRDQRIWRWEPEAVHHILAAQPNHNAIEHTTQWVDALQRTIRIVKHARDDGYVLGDEKYTEDNYFALIGVLETHPDVENADWPDGHDQVMFHYELRNLAVKYMQKVAGGKKYLAVAWLEQELGEAQANLESLTEKAVRNASYATLSDPLFPNLTRVQAHVSNEVRIALDTYHKALNTLTEPEE